MQSEAEFLAGEIKKKLLGFTLVDAGITGPAEGEDSGYFQPFPVLIFEKKVGKKVKRIEVDVQADPEGNGPGWLQIYSD
jgi:hypothetical protein